MVVRLLEIIVFVKYCKGLILGVDFLLDLGVEFVILVISY